MQFLHILPPAIPGTLTELLLLLVPQINEVQLWRNVLFAVIYWDASASRGRLLS
jgi:hypothetical protein